MPIVVLEPVKLLLGVHFISGARGQAAAAPPKNAQLPCVRPIRDSRTKYFFMTVYSFLTKFFIQIMTASDLNPRA